MTSSANGKRQGSTVTCSNRKRPRRRDSATCDRGASWLPQSSGTTENLYAVFFANDQRGFVVGAGGVQEAKLLRPVQSERDELVVAQCEGVGEYQNEPVGGDAFSGCQGMQMPAIYVMKAGDCASTR